jgi:hypothetical protein
MRVVQATDPARPKSSGHESENPRSAIRRPLELKNGGPDAWDHPDAWGQQCAGMNRSGTGPHQGRIGRPALRSGWMPVDWHRVFGSGRPPLCCNSPVRPSPGLERIRGRTGGGYILGACVTLSFPNSEPRLCCRGVCPFYFLINFKKGKCSPLPEG